MPFRSLIARSFRRNVRIISNARAFSKVVREKALFHDLKTHPSFFSQFFIACRREQYASFSRTGW